MNVNKQADAAFLAELKRTDRPRYDRLFTAMQRGQFAAIRQARQSATQAAPAQLKKAA